jgi:NADPH2 dehydrogenase
MAEKPKFSRIAQLKTPEELRNYLSTHEVDLGFDDDLAENENSFFKQKIVLKSGRVIGNRLCILPMEGWDGTTDGKPTDYVKRRWRNFAISGAKLLWGCEAVAVEPSGRANPNQLVMSEANLSAFIALHQLIIDNHFEKFGQTNDLIAGLQLTHSGRFCKPHDKKKFESKILYNHPVLDKKFSLGEMYPVMSDNDIDELIGKYIKAALLAQKAGFDFVDIKHCHGYLGHEFLSAFDRKGKYGGSFENRTRFFKNIVEGIQKNAPGLEIGVRLSSFDFVPFKKGADGVGVPDLDESRQYKNAFGCSDSGLKIDLTETKAFLRLAESLGIQLICISAGSPYYNPHLMRPALFPPSDGYSPPEEPLAGVARLIMVTAELKKEFPGLLIVGSGYSYLQEWLPNTGQYVLRNHMADFIGLGRMVLSYPTMPDDIINGRPLERKQICRTFSDCTTAPRNGIISGCYPLDLFYKNLPEAEQLKEIKKLL